MRTSERDEIRDFKYFSVGRAIIALLKAGYSVAVTGPPGCGKTSAMQLALHMFPDADYLSQWSWHGNTDKNQLAVIEVRRDQEHWVPDHFVVLPLGRENRRFQGVTT